MLRFQFLNTALGPLTIETDDPIGVNEMAKMIKRSEDNDGIVFEVMFDLEFIKGARSYLKKAFETDGGIDALVLANVYRLNVNTRKWMIYSTGSVNFNKYDVYEDKITINMEQVGVQRRVTNLMELDVDQETEVSENGNALPINNVLPAMAMHSKTIIKETIAKPADTVEHQFLDVFSQSDLPGLSTTYRERIIFGQMDTTEAEINELAENFSTQFGYSDLGGTATVGPLNAAATKVWLEANPDNRTLFPVHKFAEAGILDIDLVVKLIHEIEAVDVSGDVDVCGDAALGQIEIFHWIEIRDAENNIVLLENIGSVDMGACVGDIRTSALATLPFSQNGISVGIDYQVYWYHTIRIYGDYENQDAGSESVSHHFRIEAEDGYYFTLRSKTSAPDSTTKAVLLYEAFLRCCQYYTNDIDCFESDLLGRTDLIKPSTGEPYAVDGDAALIAWTNGAALRGLDKPIFTNLKDLIDFVNSQFCVGFGFETGADGKQRMRLEKRSFFYDKTNKILSLGKIYNVRKTIDPKRYYNSVEFGYASKIDLGQTNAIDAFNTKRRNSIPIINTKNGLKIATKVKADGYQIEGARRLKFTTTDGKNDDEPFVVCVIRDGITFKSKKDEGYTLIENVFDSSTGYNYDISPARSLRNWFKIIASALIYAKSKVIKFTFGEVNFLMRTQKTGEDFIVEENGNVDLTDVEPDYDNFIYELKDVDISDDLVQHICDNPYGYIDFEDQFGELMEGFISDNGIEHDQFKGKADFKLLKVFRP